MLQKSMSLIFVLLIFGLVACVTPPQQAQEVEVEQAEQAKDPLAQGKLRQTRLRQTRLRQTRRRQTRLRQTRLRQTHWRKASASMTKTAPPVMGSMARGNPTGVSPMTRASIRHHRMTIAGIPGIIRMRCCSKSLPKVAHYRQRECPDLPIN